MGHFLSVIPGVTRNLGPFPFWMPGLAPDTDPESADIPPLGIRTPWRMRPNRQLNRVSGLLGEDQAITETGWFMLSAP